MTAKEIRILVGIGLSQGIITEEDQRDVQRLELNGLIEETLNKYHLTERGRAHIEQLCTTPWPTQAWIGADGKVIEMGEE